ncbi:uncharacterized protein LOC119162298 isoform X2 [Rhipicephalus microplus]|uniref:uncharacterized protein LOC119162298 isoform X2 n=1 Tax=Rhipicephalus microplus TaxID=6941 RepID=UPI003F6CBF21
MACILEKFSASLNKDISSQTIWEHLDTMYDMAALHEAEIIPFPNYDNEFVLPDNDFGDLMSSRPGSSKRAPSPAARSSTGGEVRGDDCSASKKPEATGGKTGKDDWNAAKVPSAGVKIRRGEGEPASRPGCKSSMGVAPRKSDVGTPNHSASSVSKIKRKHVHGKVKIDSTPSHKSSPASSNAKAQKADTSTTNSQTVPRRKKRKSDKKSDSKSEPRRKKSKSDKKSDSKHQDGMHDKQHKQPLTKAKGKSRTDGSKRKSKNHPRGEPKDGGGANTSAGTKPSKAKKLPRRKSTNTSAGTKPSKAKKLHWHKSEGKDKAEDDNTSAKGSFRQVKEDLQETTPKRKRTSRIDASKSGSSQTTKSRRRGRHQRQDASSV